MRQLYLARSPSAFVLHFFIDAIVASCVHVTPAPVAEIYGVDDKAWSAFQQARAQCAFLVDWASHSPIPAFMPPDAAEHFAHSANYLVEGAQSRKSSGIAAPKRVVPVGLEPVAFFEQALLEPSPLQEEPNVSADLEFSVRKVCELGADIDKWRDQQWKLFCDCAVKCQHLTSSFDAQRSLQSAKCAPNIDLVRLQIGVHAIAWPDLQLKAMFGEGACPIGRQQNIGIFRQKVTTATAGEDQLLKAHAGLLNHPLKHPPEQWIDVVWEQTLQEQELGFFSGFMEQSELDLEFGPGNWATLPRFPLWQKNKWRMIDNGGTLDHSTDIGHNSLYQADETIHTTSSAAGMALARCYRRVRGRKLDRKWKLAGSSKDLWKAYRQVPVHPSQQRFLIIRVWCRAKRRWLYCKAFVLLFGLAGAVLHFNRLPTFFVAFLRRILAVPIQHFFDDHRILEPMITGGSAFRWAQKVADYFGFRFDVGKDAPPTPLLHLLGNLEDYRMVAAEDTAYLEAKPERLADVTCIVVEALKARKRPQAAAASLRGKILHLAHTCPARTGRVPLNGLGRLADGKQTHEWGSDVQYDLEMVLLGLALPHRRAYHLSSTPQHPVVIISDASFEPEGIYGKLRICAIVATASQREGVVIDVPESHSSKLVTRKTHIAFGELLAFAMAVFFFPHVLQQRSTIAFIDNMAVIHQLVNGATREYDSGGLTHALHHRFVALQMQNWFEWVPSPSNLADGGSRKGSTCELALEAQVTLNVSECPPFPENFPKSSLVQWDRWWQSARQCELGGCT